MLTLDSEFLSAAEVKDLTGCAKPDEQEAELKRQGLPAKRRGNRLPTVYPSDAFPCSDGYLMMIIGNDGQFAIHLRFDPAGARTLEMLSMSYRGKRLVIQSQFPSPRWIGTVRMERRIADGALLFRPEATRDEAARIGRISTRLSLIVAVVLAAVLAALTPVVPALFTAVVNVACTVFNTSARRFGGAKSPTQALIS